MKRLMQVTAAVAMAVALTACGGDDSANRETTTGGTGGAVTGTTGSFDADRDFVEEQIALGDAEIELGRVAQQRATHPDVKEYGAMMVRDHQAANQELRAIMSTAGAARPSDRADDRAAGAARDMMDRAQGAAADVQTEVRELQEELGRLSGREFDRRYIDEMIEDHEDAIDDLEDKANNASHPEVKAWAAKTLPKMREHLEHARTLKQTLESISDQR
jgi:putative membrane protein